MTPNLPRPFSVRARTVRRVALVMALVAVPAFHDAPPLPAEDSPVSLAKDGLRGSARVVISNPCVGRFFLEEGGAAANLEARREALRVSGIDFFEEQSRKERGRDPRESTSLYARGALDPFAREALLARLADASLLEEDAKETTATIALAELKLRLPAPFSLFEGVDVGMGRDLDQGYPFRVSPASERLASDERTVDELMLVLRDEAPLRGVRPALGLDDWALIYRGAKAAEAIANRLREDPPPPAEERNLLARVLVRLDCDERVPIALEELTRRIEGLRGDRAEASDLAPLIQTLLLAEERGMIPILQTLGGDINGMSELQWEAWLALACFGQSEMPIPRPPPWGVPLVVPESLVEETSTRDALDLAGRVGISVRYDNYVTSPIEVGRRDRRGEVEVFGLIDGRSPEAGGTRAETGLEIVLGPIHGRYRAFCLRGIDALDFEFACAGLMLNTDDGWRSVIEPYRWLDY